MSWGTRTASPMTARLPKIPTSVSTSCAGSGHYPHGSGASSAGGWTASAPATPVSTPGNCGATSSGAGRGLVGTLKRLHRIGKPHRKKCGGRTACKVVDGVESWGRCPRPRPVGRSMLGAAAETAEVEGVVVAALRRDSGRAVPATDAVRAAASRLGSAAVLRAEVDAHLAGGGRRVHCSHGCCGVAMVVVVVVVLVG